MTATEVPPEPERLPRWDAAPLVELDIGLADPWKVVLPRVFRYLEQEFIDLFFETGALRLSSFALFSQHADEQRRDNEGPSINFGTFTDPDDPENAGTVVTVSSTGHQAFVLCGSTLESATLLDAFEVDGCFAIENVLGLANAVRRHVPGCMGGLQGQCVYSPRGRVINRRLDRNPVANHGGSNTRGRNR